MARLVLDKVAWVRLDDPRACAQMRWMTYADRDRVSPLDQVVFDALLAAGHLF